MDGNISSYSGKHGREEMLCTEHAERRYWGSQAFLINNHVEDIEVLELGDDLLDEADEWNEIAEPILDELGFGQVAPDDPLPRIIWIPTGPLSHLPLHAAGIHTPGSPMTVLDRVVFSYASSLKSFVLGRRQKQTTTAYSGRKAMLVGVGDAQYMPRLTPLPFVAREIDQIEKICASFKLESTTLKESITRQVLDNMDGCAIFHFAGHGRVDPLEPSQSGIVMRDGLLTVANLMDAKLQSKPPFLAFLSACLSGANDVIELQDERSSHQRVPAARFPARHWDAVADLRDHWVKNGQSSIRGGFDSQSESQRDRERSVEEVSSCNTEDKEENWDIPRERRDARLLLEGESAEDLVRVDCIPYIHYGP
ncbi:CHAT domain-containing protein [Ilyonectria sp. MPI-CAGE-AT-0026]|nr:CHAT domain-containing protein [Ilyonectria sp. MPI-CAGE-AT-0026]